MSHSEPLQDQDKTTVPFKNSRHRLPLRTLLILIGIIFLMYIILMPKLVTFGDYVHHIDESTLRSQGIDTDSIPGRPCHRCSHHLYEYITIAIESILPGENFELAAILTAMLAYVTLAIVVATSFHRQLYGQHPWQAAALTIALLVTGPILIFNLTSGNFYQSYIYLHPISYHSPTATLMRPLALIVFLYGAAALLPPAVSWIHVAMAAFVAVLVGNAKPNFSVTFVPAAFVVIFYRFWRKRFVDYRVILAIVGMMLVVLATQYLYTFSGGAASGGVAVGPFVFLMRRGFEIPDILLKHLLSFVMPLAVLVLYWREARTDSFLGLAWVTFLFGLFFELLIVEPGDRIDHGNYYWSGEIALFILFFATIHFWLRVMKGRLNFKERRAHIIWGLWALHLVGGVYWYAAHLLIETSQWGLK